ncbi:MAG: hypothetical protein J6A01_01305, partial [Proteobacteria bacterium]|nr:hypothetical protein [Pseudomonadota bacterium]
MKRLVTCLLFLGLVMIGCDGDDSAKECTPKCASGQVCVNGSCQTANSQDNPQPGTPTGTSPGQQTGDPQDGTNPTNPPSDEGQQPGDPDTPPNDQTPPNQGDDTNPPNQGDDTNPPDPVNPPEDEKPPQEDEKPTDEPQQPDNPPASGGHACGSKTCKLEQLCLNGQCVDRSNKATEGVKCDPKTFVESCDNNNLVHCDCDEETKECKTAVSVCDKLTCALMVKENYGMCAKADEKCKAEGEMTMCYDIENGFTSYIEYWDCTLATDGKYYPFRTDKKDVDCIGTCLDKYSCNQGEEKCGSDFKDYC